MSFTWPWPKPRQQTYSTLQQVEVDDAAQEIEKTPEKTSGRRPQIVLALFLLINTALLCVAVQVYLQGSLKAGTHHHERLIRSPIPECQSSINNAVSSIQG